MASHQLSIINNSEVFEDAICDLFNSLESTNTFKKFGTKGHKQKGIDIFSSSFDLAIQCKKKDLSRRDVALRKELLDDIEKDVLKMRENSLNIKISKLYIVSTYKDHPDIDEYCEELKVRIATDFEIIYWGWNTLESKILDYKTILEKYWPNFIVNTNAAEKNLKRNVELKKNLERDLADWINYSFENRKKNSEMIIRSWDTCQYPESNEPDSNGQYSWFAEEIKNLYHQGLEFIVGSNSIVVNEDNTWDYVNASNSDNLNIVKVFKVGQINFSDIVDYDPRGDEYYNCPHFFCKFVHNGKPFERYYFYNPEKPFQRFELADKKSIIP